MPEVALKLVDVHKSFGSSKIIDGVNLEVTNGERHAIIGPNGAGKSTLFNLISGFYEVSSGYIELNGHTITNLVPHQVNRFGLARSFQVTNIFPKMSVFENIRCALLWPMGYRYSFRHLCGRLKQLNEKAEEILEKIHMADRRHIPAGLLAYAEQRALEIGITIAGNAEVILLDEPTAGMSHSETDRAVDLIRSVTEDKTLVVVEHDMSVVFDLAARISVLVYGDIIATDVPDNIRSNPEVQEAYLGKEVVEMLEVKDLHAYYGRSHILQGVDLQVESGEIVSLLGRNGVGRSTTCKTIMGLVPPHGSITYEGEEIAGLKPHTIARKGIGFVPEDRWIFPGLTVLQNLQLGFKSKKSKGRWSIDDVFELFPKLGERTNVQGGLISGGEKQMLTICRTLMGDPNFIMIDEPTEGLAPKMVELVRELIEEIARRGISVLLVEQKLSIALKISQRIYIMGHGKIVFEGTPEDLSADQSVRKEWLEV